jgi:dihydroneopterin aldolase
MGKIIVEGIKIYAYHGCFKEETAIGTNFTVDVVLDVDLEKPAHTDEIQDTVNYQTVFEVVKDQMAIPSKLLEHVAKRIIDTLFIKFPTINKIKIKVSKLNVPLGGHIDKVSVELKRKRKNYTDRSIKCSKCGEEFKCKPQGGCWCNKYELTPNQLQEIKDNYEDCLCEECVISLLKKTV